MSSPLTIGSIVKRNRVESWNDIDPMFGDVLFSLDGIPHFRDEPWSDEFERPWPAVLDNAQTVCGDLIPATSWGASLANLLTRGSWGEMRQTVIDHNHHVCQCCGVQLTALDVHEVWHYTFPDQNEIDLCRKNEWAVMGVQKLVTLISVCDACHLCFHPGFANSQGQGSEALDRLRALNNWTVQQVLDYEKLVFERWEHANQFQWQLDLSRILHPHGGLTVNNRWKLVPGSDVFLTRTDSDGHENLTVLLNTPWRFSKESGWRKANPYP